MPSVRHEAPLELLRNNPQLAAVLLSGLGVPVPEAASATMVSADLSASVHYDHRKRYSWPTYLTQVRAAQRCPAVLLVICAGTATATRCRRPIRTGHPGFDLAPLVIDCYTMPGPGTPGRAAVAPELAVLGVLTGELDLDQDSARQEVLASLAGLEDSRLAAYTVFVRSAASDLARQALEDLMTTKFKDDFVDRFRAEGEARMVLRILAARGLRVPDKIREQVLACKDTRQLETWGDRAVTAESVDDVFGS